MKALLYIARHGDTALNTSNKFRGWKNVPLAPEGHQEAQKLAEFFSDKNIGSVHASDLQRAADTAATIAKPQGKSVEKDAQFRPWHVGQLAGQSKDKHKGTMQAHIDNPDSPLPGGESLNQFRGRFTPAFEDLLTHAERHGKPPVLVAHASNIHEIGNIINGDPDSANVHPGGVLAVYPKGKSGLHLHVIHGRDTGPQTVTS